jgi:PAS domain S-box-containing protein
MVPPILVIIAIPFLYLAAHARLALFDLHFNKFALLSAFGTLLVLIVMILARRETRRSYEMVWFNLLFADIFLLGACETLTRLSVQPKAAIFWELLETGTGAMVGVLLFLFALHYAYADRPHTQFTTFAVLGGVVVVFLSTATNTVALTDPSQVITTPWGYLPGLGPLNTVYDLWGSLWLLSAVGVLLRFRRRAPNLALRKQATFFAASFMAPIIAAIVTDFWLSNVMPTKVPPMSVFFTAVMAVALLIGLKRYQIFRVSPSLLAQNVLATMHESVIVTDAGLHIVSLNREAERLFTKNSAQVMGRPISVLLHSIDPKELEKHHLTSTQTSGSVLEDLDFRVYDTEGNRLYLSASVSTLREGKSIEGYVFTLSDITALKRTHAELIRAKEDVERQVKMRTLELQEERARLQASIDSLEVGFVMTFRGSQALSYNPMLLKILKLDNPAPGHLTLKKLDQYLQDYDLIAAVEKCQHTGKSFRTTELAYGDRILSIGGAPIKSDLNPGVVIGVVILVTDITEVKMLERSKDEFFSIASHELRTPLTAIKGNTSMIIQYFPQVMDDSNLKEMINDMHESSVRLIDIVNDFLDVSRIEQGRLTFKYEPVNFQEIVESVVYEMKAILQERQLYLKFDKMTLGSLPQVWADKNRVKQILYNLVGNATKFTDSGGISINTEVVDGMVKVSVTDTGHGIPLDSQKLLFRKFQQATNNPLTRDSTRGTGLGLYISKKLIEMMRGKIELEHSEVNKGTTFAFTLPVATAKQLAEGAQPTPKQEVKA